MIKTSRLITKLAEMSCETMNHVAIIAVSGWSYALSYIGCSGEKKKRAWLESASNLTHVLVTA